MKTTTRKTRSVTRSTSSAAMTTILACYILLLMSTSSSNEILVVVDAFLPTTTTTTTTTTITERIPSISTTATISSPSSKTPPTTKRASFVGALFATGKKPQRYEDNADGVVYVNDKCINCAACSMFAPSTFGRSSKRAAHIVYEQPTTDLEIGQARSALAACPVAAIRIETLAERRHRAASNEEKKHAEDTWTTKDQTLVDRMSLRSSGTGSTKNDDNDNNNSEKPFPRPFLDDATTDVYWIGHHNDRSFGACPYLFRTTRPSTQKNDDGSDDLWIMVDTPRYSKSSVDAVTQLTGPDGPDYLFLTHVDDTADHQKWRDRFSASSKSNLKRIFHAGDLGPHNWIGDTTLENVELLLVPPPKKSKEHGQKENDAALVAYDLSDGSILPDDWEDRYDASELPVVILYTPGHSPGSITLYKRPTTVIMTNGRERQRRVPGILFTGDTYAYRVGRESTNSDETGGCMTGFPRYGNDLRVQSKTIQKLLRYDWDIVAPGHGHPRDYRRQYDGGTGSTAATSVNSKRDVQANEMQDAINELHKSAQVAYRY